MIDYIDVVEQLKEIALNNDFIKQFEYGKKEDLQEIYDSWNNEFPAMWVNPVSFVSKEYTFIYQMELDIFSIIQDSEEDADKVISDCNAIMLDVINKLRDYTEGTDYTITPYYWKEETGELMAGVMCNISLEYSTDNNQC